jgi:hypothetical protein
VLVGRSPHMSDLVVVELGPRRRVVQHDGRWLLQRYIDRSWLSCRSFTRRKALIDAVRLECGPITRETDATLAALPVDIRT